MGARKKISPAVAALAGAALAVGGIAGTTTAPTPAPVQQQAVTAQQQKATQDQAPAQATQVQAIDVAALGFGRVPARLRRHEPVWIGYPRPRNDHKHVNRRRQRAVNA